MHYEARDTTCRNCGAARSTHVQKRDGKPPHCTAVTAERAFPILSSDGESIPWRAIAPHEEQAHRNHGQSLARLARRGGLEWCEALAVLEDRPWRKMPLQRARQRVLAIIGGAPTCSCGKPLADCLDH